MSRQLMLVPSLACPAACKYCFGPHEGGGVMPLAAVAAIVQWQRRSDEKLKVTFHGGEPLMAGAGFYRAALPRLREGLAHRKPSFSMQSNLWLLDEELCDVFIEERLTLGTSLDGPEKINDAQRGEGSFRRTMAGIELARRNGLDVGCICTFTPRSLPHLRKIFDFFIEEGLSFTIHAAVPSLRGGEAGAWALTVEQHTGLLVGALGMYLEQAGKVRIGTLDLMCRSVAAGRGGICTFSDCLGGYLAVGPDGSIYPCQRFAGMPGYVMGRVTERRSLRELERSPVWRMFAERQERLQDECGDCAFFDLCRGGCPYNALASGRGSFAGSLKDPYCAAYNHAFRVITDAALEEVFSEENMKAVVGHPGKSLLRKGRLLGIMKGGLSFTHFRGAGSRAGVRAERVDTASCELPGMSILT